MLVRDLGSLLVERDGDVLPMGPSRQTALLARLAMEPNRRVSATALKAAAWGPDMAVSSGSLDSQLWRLRNRLEPGRTGRASTMVVRDGSAYRLQIDPRQVDSAHFLTLTAQAEQLAPNDSTEAVLDVIDEALSLWRGRPFEPITDQIDVAPAAARLEERREQLRQLRVVQLMRHSRFELALADLTPLIAATPYREQLWLLRLQALAALGRREEALASYQQIRNLLADELGLDPSADLQDLHVQILTGSALPSHATHSAASLSIPHPASRIAPLPSALLGRDRDHQRIIELLAQRDVITITGAGGSGKTSLARQAGAATADSYPDGTFFIDLTQIANDSDVVDHVASTLGLALGAGNEMSQLAVLTSQRQLLIILDNCEHVLRGASDCARALTTDNRGPTVLATSREPLDINGEAVWSLAPLSSLPHDASNGHHAPAVQLFIDRAGDAAPEKVFTADAHELIARICRAVDGLPLAIELAAARMRSFSLPEIVDQVTSDPSRLSRLGRGRVDNRSGLFETIDWSYRLLPPTQKVLHRQLSVLPGMFTTAAASGILRGRQSDPDLPQDLASLVHQSMLIARTGERSTTFTQLATIRAHAHRTLVDAGEEQAVLARRDEWVLQLLRRRPRLGDPIAGAWYDTVEADYPTVHAALDAAVTGSGNDQLAAIGSGLAFFWFFRSRAIEGRNWLSKAAVHESLENNDAAALATKLRLAGAGLMTQQPELARPHLQEALAQIRDHPIADRTEIVEALVCAGGGAWAGQAFDLLEIINAALDKLTDQGDTHLQLFAQALRCVANRAADPAGLRRRAEDLYTEAIDHGNLIAAWFTALKRCVVSPGPADTLAWTRRVIDLHRRLGPGGSRPFLETLANSIAAAGDYTAAVPIYAATAQLARETGTAWPTHTHTNPLFDQARSHLDPSDFQRAWQDGTRLGLHDLGTR